MKSFLSKKLPSLVLAAALMLSLGAAALADDEPVSDAAPSVKLSLRVEGKTENVFYAPEFAVAAADTDSKPTALDAINAFAIAEPGITVRLEESEYGQYLAAVGEDAEKTAADMDGWMFLVNGESAVAGISATELDDGDVVVFYYSDEYGIGLQHPTVDESRLAAEGVVRFTSRDTAYDENWNAVVTVNPVAGASVTFNGDEYVTDENGEIRPENYFASYNKVQIERYDEETGVPTVLRYAADYETSFPDVEADPYGYDTAIRWATLNGVINGAEGKFNPGDNMTRAALVTVLYRIDGSPEPETTDEQFSDVDYSETSWYAAAVRWATENEIVNGAGDGKFDPNKNITRQELAVTLERYIGYKGLAYVVTQEYVLFADEDEIADWAKNALQLLYKLGIMPGRDGTMNPQGIAQRAEIALLLQRFDALEPLTSGEPEADTEPDTEPGDETAAETEGDAEDGEAETAGDAADTAEAVG
ncbi:MAG: S-layer homology domain-containing protein [Oscillospiraceae bacterium]|jgi:hypothetical protein|nr:S-layer homology domain-containing protein [Oscillospiraceae bacterium]